MMHPDMLSELVADRKRELAASGSPRARPLRPRRDRRVADQASPRREWRALLRALYAR